MYMYGQVTYHMCPLDGSNLWPCYCKKSWQNWCATKSWTFAMSSLFSLNIYTHCCQQCRDNEEVHTLPTSDVCAWRYSKLDSKLKDKTLSNMISALLRVGFWTRWPLDVLSSLYHSMKLCLVPATLNTAARKEEMKDFLLFCHSPALWE